MLVDQRFDINVTYKTTSAGSAVLETMFSGTPHEMISVIHPDGHGLALTHYCGLGNQPRMISSGRQGNVVVFKFAGCSNMKSDRDDHMHDVTYTLVDPNTLRSEWTYYHEGKASGKDTIELKRKR